MLTILPIIIAILLLAFLSYKKVNVVVLALITTICLCLMSGLPVLESVKTTYLTGVGGFITNNFLIFFLSIVFGRVMELTGAAASIADFLANKLGEKFAVLGVMFAGSLLVYGGVTTLVVIFSLLPIAFSVFKRVDLSRNLIPGVIAAGCFSYACAFFPGTPQLVNAISMSKLGTSAMAAPVVGVISGIVVMVLSVVYILYVARKSKQKGEHFEINAELAASVTEIDSENLPNAFLSIVPILVVLVVLNVIKLDLLIAMACGSIACAALFWKHLCANVEGGVSGLGMGIFEYSAKNAAIAIVNTAVIVGFGAVVQTTNAFQALIEMSTSFNASPLVSLGTMTTVLSGACGSGSGGLSIALEALSGKYLEMGLSPEIIHRIATIACVGLDSLPHAGALYTLFTLTGTSVKSSYKHIFVTTVLFTLIGLAVAIAVGTVMYPIG